MNRFSYLLLLPLLSAFQLLHKPCRLTVFKLRIVWSFPSLAVAALITIVAHMADVSATAMALQL